MMITWLTLVVKNIETEDIVTKRDYIYIYIVIWSVKFKKKVFIIELTVLFEENFDWALHPSRNMRICAKNMRICENNGRI